VIWHCWTTVAVTVTVLAGAHVGGGTTVNGGGTITVVGGGTTVVGGGTIVVVVAGQVDVLVCVSVTVVAAHLAHGTVTVVMTVVTGMSFTQQLFAAAQK